MNSAEDLYYTKKPFVYILILVMRSFNLSSFRELMLQCMQLKGDYELLRRTKVFD